MPAGKKYRQKKRPMKKRRKQRVATAVTTKAVQKALLPLQERKYFQDTPAYTNHVTFNVAGAPVVSTDGQLSINAAVAGLVPKDVTIAIPNAFLTLANQGSGIDQVEGRKIRSRTLSMRAEIDFSTLHANESTIQSHWYITKGWCKNTIMKGCHNPNSSAPGAYPAVLPTSINAHNIAASTLIAKALVQDGFQSDPLHYRVGGLPRNIIIEKHFKVKPNLNDRYAAIVADGGGAVLAANELTYIMPKTYYFNWKFDKPQILDNVYSPYGYPSGGPESNLGMFRSWIPFLMLSNKDASSAAHTVTPLLRTSSKMTFTDM